MEWYEEMDFDSNPFERETKLVGFEDLLEEMLYAIVSGNMIFIEGETGSGKTLILTVFDFAMYSTDSDLPKKGSSKKLSNGLFDFPVLVPFFWLPPRY